MNMDFELLKRICETPGAPGYEQPIRKLVMEQAAPHADELYTDHLGSVIALKKGKSNDKKVLLAAHMDEISFMVTHIDEQGFLRVHPLGGFDPKTLTSMRVWVHGKQDLPGVMGSKPIHIMGPEERKKMPEIKDFYIDLGLPKEEVDKVVEVGNTVTRRQELTQMGHMISGKSLDNRVSVYIQLEWLRTVGQPAYDTYAVFTVQEEVGLRGASVAAHQINPDFGLAIDVTIANDTPGVPGQEKVTQLGQGAAIKLYDSSTICDYRMVDFLKSTAKSKGIDWQPEILTAGGTDTAGLQRMGKNGAIAGAISIPLRYVHQVIETAHPKDVMACVDLLKAATEGINNYKWDF